MPNNPQTNKKKTNKSVSEQGHRKNLENFKRLYNFCETHNPTYNPVVHKIQLPQLHQLIIDAETAYQAVLTTHGPLIITINQRQQLYQPLKKLVTRVIQALDAISDDKRGVNDARGYIRKIQGKTNKPKTQSNHIDTNNPEQNNPNNPTQNASISNSQQSYDKLREHLLKLIILLEKTPAYKPNETELTTSSLRNYLQQLIDIESQITKVRSTYNGALIQRDNVFYETNNSLKPVAEITKTYLKSLFGTNSLEFLTIKNLSFKKIKR